MAKLTISVYGSSNSVAARSLLLQDTVQAAWEAAGCYCVLGVWAENRSSTDSSLSVDWESFRSSRVPWGNNCAVFTRVAGPSACSTFNSGTLANGGQKAT